MPVVREEAAKSVEELVERIGKRRGIGVGTNELPLINELRNITDALVLLLKQREHKSK